jgi:DNA-binding NtrC family response regulator
MAALLAYPWPGNVRELRNLIERAMILARGPTLQVAVRPPLIPVADKAPERVPAKASAATLEAMEREHILRVLEQTGWRIRGSRGAAERLGIKPTTLESRMKRLGLRRPSSDIS